MKIAEYAAKWNRDEDNNFAAACYNDNSIKELKEALENGPCKIDMGEWMLCENEWVDAITTALSELSSC